MASLVTGVINGFQGSSAAHNAAGAASAGFNKAATTMGDSVNNAGTTLANAANSAVQLGTDGAKNAQDLALGAQATGATNLTNTAAAGANAATAAGAAAGAGVTDAAAGANDLLNPYVKNGAAASDALATAMGPGGSLAPKSASDIMQNDPGYQFQLQQGKQALARAAAASGQSGSGAFLKSLANYTTGAAQSGYQQAFQDTLAQQNQQYNQLKGVSDSGQTAATTAGGQKMAGAEYAGNAGMQTSEFGSTMNTGAAAANATSGNQAAQYAGNAGIEGNEYGGNALLKTAGQMSQNDMTGGAFEGNAQIGSGEAIAQGDMGAANAWSGALNGIGNGLNSFITGGWGAGKGFNLGGAMTGNSKYGMS